MENIKEMGLKDFGSPAIVAGGSVGLCLLVRSATGYSLGIECKTFGGALKAFLLITGVGGAVALYNKKGRE